MKNVTGPPVEGDDFHGRVKELDYVWNLITDGNHIILPSPRRVGKSSFAKRLIKTANEKGWRTVEINLEKITDEANFIKIFVEELKKQSWWEGLKGKLGKTAEDILTRIKPTIEVEGAKVAIEWTSIKTDIYEKLGSLLDHDKETLIMLDELTVLLTEMQKSTGKTTEVEKFLHWLRSLRQVTATKIRWIFCSSVGIENFTHTYGLSDTINELTPYHLKAFDEATSHQLLNELAKNKNIVLPETVRQEIIKTLGWCLPYFLQIMFQKLHYLYFLEEHILDESIVPKAYRALLDESYLNTWIERLHEQYGENTDHAFLILEHICQQNEGVKREHLLNVLASRITDPDKCKSVLSSLIYMLGNDGYLFEEGGLYAFRSPLLRDFWFKRHIK